MARRDRSDSDSPVNRRQSSPPRRRERDRSPPPRHRSSRRSDSPVRPTPHKTRSSDRERPSGRALSPKPAASRSRSPSPRTKRLRRAQDEREEEKLGERRRGRDGERNGRGGDGDLKERDRGKDKAKSDVRDRGERRSKRDDNELPKRNREHERSSSPLEHHHKEKHEPGSHSKDTKRDYDEEKGAGSAEQNGNEDDSVARMKAAEEALAKKKEQPSFELSGKLADETNRVKGVTLLFNEPPEARKPDIRWRLYVFKAGEMLNEPLYIHRQSCYLFGRERRVADIPTDHPSCSKQHAVIQYRQIEREQPDGMLKKVTRPYLMDLGSTNGTFINDNRLEPQRYYELIEQDTIKFGNSSREYVILHENSAKGD